MVMPTGWRTAEREPGAWPRRIARLLLGAFLVFAGVAHLTLAREEFRHRSLLAAHCRGVLSGLGLDGYRLAVDHLVRNPA